MDPTWSESPVFLAVVGFLAAVAGGLLVGIVGLGDAWHEATLRGISLGIVLSITFYLYFTVGRESGTIE